MLVASSPETEAKPVLNWADESPDSSFDFEGTPHLRACPCTAAIPLALTREREQQRGPRTSGPVSLRLGWIFFGATRWTKGVEVWGVRAHIHRHAGWGVFSFTLSFIFNLVVFCVSCVSPAGPTRHSTQWSRDLLRWVSRERIIWQSLRG